MEKKKPTIKTLPKQASEQEGGITNRVVFTIYCKDVIDGIKRQIPKKIASFKQIVAYSLISMDDETKREVCELIKNNKAFDVVVEKWIHNHKKQVLDLFEKQRDKTSSTAVLKNRIQELEEKLAKGGKNE